MGQIKHSQRSEPSVLTGGVQGPTLGPLVGSRGEALVGVQGAEPPKASEFYLF